MTKKPKKERPIGRENADLDRGNLAVDLEPSDLVPEPNNKLAVLHEQASSVLAQVDETPRDRLLAAVSGKQPVRREDTEALLADHILTSEEQAKDLSRTCKDLVDYMFAGNSGRGKKKQDPSVTLDLVTKMTNLHKIHAEEMRRSIELLARIQRPRPPQIQVVAVDSGQVNVSDKQINNSPIDLGGRSERS